MKLLRRALCVFFLLTCAAHAQSDDDESPLGDFQPIDDELVLYIPKFAVRLGFRGLSGASTSFSGQGLLSSRHTLGDQQGLLNRTYHDGYVFTDTRTATDPSGSASPITPDGQTNNWGFTNALQVGTGEYSGLIGFNAYSATVTDTTSRDEDTPTAFGVEVSVEREFGSFFGGRVKWGVIGGMSINQISVDNSSNLTASVLTTTDYYSLNGRTPPTPPYTGPQFAGTVDTTVLLGSEPVARVFTSTTSTTAFSNFTRLRGGYLTFRVGPTVFVPFTERFSATVSAGGVLVLAGTTLEIEQTFKPETGDIIGEAMENDVTKLLPGFFIDANLQFAITDTAGLYLGGVYQSSGEYTQELSSPDEKSNYSTRVDLSRLQGIRAGVSFKF